MAWPIRTLDSSKYHPRHLSVFVPDSNCTAVVRREEWPGRKKIEPMKQLASASLPLAGMAFDKEERGDNSDSAFSRRCTTSSYHPTALASPTHRVPVDLH